jgi:hypothetical protein
MDLEVDIRPIDHNDQQEVQSRRAGNLPHPSDPDAVVRVGRRYGDDKTRQVNLRQSRGKTQVSEECKDCIAAGPPRNLDLLPRRGDWGGDSTCGEVELRRKHGLRHLALLRQTISRRC